MPEAEVSMLPNEHSHGPRIFAITMRKPNKPVQLLLICPRGTGAIPIQNCASQSAIVFLVPIIPMCRYSVHTCRNNDAMVSHLK